MTSTTSRLLGLLSLLQSRRDWSGSLLADRLEVSHRTVRRDVDRLRGMGYRIAATRGPDGGYRLDAGSELPPLLFDDDQAIAVAVALQSAAATGAEIEESALRALTTVRQVMPSRLRHRVDALRFTALPRSAASKADRVRADLLLTVSTAIRGCEVIRFDYPSTTSAPVDGQPARPRRVEPHHLVMSEGKWYLVGYDLDRDDWRIFRADRLELRSPNTGRFTPRTIPGGGVGEFVAARFRGSTHADEWPCVGRVVLHAPARAVIPFAGDGIVEDLGPDRCALESGAWSWVGLAASLGRFDVAIEVIAPPELSEAFAHLSRVFADAGSAVPDAGSAVDETAGPPQDGATVA